MRDLDLTSLRLFVAVCETRNIARAAEQQAIVGSAISKRLAALEDTVGTQLLVRRRHGVAPTPAVLVVCDPCPSPSRGERYSPCAAVPNTNWLFAAAASALARK